MTFRKTTTPATLLRKAASTDMRAAGLAARDAVTGGVRQAAAHGARLAADKPVRMTAGIAAVATVGVLASAPWAGAATGPADVAHAGQAPVATQAAPQGTPSAAGGGPRTIYDSTSPAAIPAGQHVATYSNGAYQASAASVADRGNVLWIDTNGTNTHASALDVEPGDATPAQAAQWVSHKLSASPGTDAIVYTFKAQWGAVQDSIHALPASMQSHVKYWIADPTGTPHNVPGAAATQWYWGPSYDITQAQPGFFS